MRNNALDFWTRTVAAGLGLFAPGLAMKWASGRMMLRHYTAAKTSGPNGAWRPTKKSADQILKRDAALIRERARDLERNAPHIAGAVNTITSNVVYLGIPPQAQLRNAEGKPDVEANRRAEALFSAWSEETDFADLQTLAFRRMFIDGEILVHPVPRFDLDRLGIVPLGLELLEADHLDDKADGWLPNGNEMRRGVEFTPTGEVAAYHVLTRHPGDGISAVAVETVRVPASDMELAFNRFRPSQTRGVSWLSPIIMEAFDYAQFQSYHRIAAKLMAAYVRYIKTDIPEAMDPTLTGGAGIGGGATASGERKFGPNFPEFPQPAQTVFLPNGMTIQESQYTHPGPYYEAFSKISLKGTAAGLGLPYSTFAGDYSDASYSADRAAQLASRRYYQVCQVIFARAFLRPCWRQFWRFATVSGLARRANLPARIPVRWQFPGWEWVDPMKDAVAAERDLANMLTTRRRLCERKGVDFDTILEERKQEEEAMAAAGFLPAKTEGKNNAA